MAHGTGCKWVVAYACVWHNIVLCKRETLVRGHWEMVFIDVRQISCAVKTTKKLKSQKNKSEIWNAHFEPYFHLI